MARRDAATAIDNADFARPMRPDLDRAPPTPPRQRKIRTRGAIGGSFVPEPQSAFRAALHGRRFLPLDSRRSSLNASARCDFRAHAIALSVRCASSGPPSPTPGVVIGASPGSLFPSIDTFLSRTRTSRSPDSGGRRVVRPVADGTGSKPVRREPATLVSVGPAGEGENSQTLTRRKLGPGRAFDCLHQIHPVRPEILVRLRAHRGTTGEKQVRRCVAGRCNAHFHSAPRGRFSCESCAFLRSVPSWL